MSSSPLLLLCLLAALLWPAAGYAQRERFDVQAFRPLGAPLDLARVAQSRPLAHGSLVGGLFLHHMVDPLVLVHKGTNAKAVSLVGSRLQVDVLATVGLWDWGELGLVLPLVVAQGGDNLEAIGTEGPVQPWALGDLRLQGKLALPGLRRPAGDSGLGAALTLGVGLPTGNVQAFAGDGALTSQPGLVVDWRFHSGALLSLNTGLWLRPRRTFIDTRWGSLATLGLGAELPVTPSRHITAMGLLTMATPLEGLSLSTLPRQRPTEALLGLRWYGPQGLTYTLGAGTGCNCSLTVPSFRVFASVVWVPPGMPERHALEQTLSGESLAPAPTAPPEVPLYAQPVDSDNDYVLTPLDECPLVPGPVENRGCPDKDSDGDSVVDRLDSCPRHAQSLKGSNGCPLARLERGQLALSKPLQFVTGQPILHPDTEPVLEEVARLLLAHPEVAGVEVLSWSHVAEEQPLALAEQRAERVRVWLLEEGIALDRVCTAVQVAPAQQPLAGGRAELVVLEGSRRCPGARGMPLAEPPAPQPEAHRQRVAARLQEYARWAERLRSQPPRPPLLDSPERQQALAALAEASLAWAHAHKDDPLLLERSPHQVALYLLTSHASLSMAQQPAPAAPQEQATSLLPFFQQHPTLALSLELGVGLLPGLGELDDAESAAVGVSLTGTPLSPNERTLYAASVLVPFISGVLTVKVARVLAPGRLLAGRSAQEVQVLARVAEHLSPEEVKDIQRVLERIGEAGEATVEELEVLERVAQKLQGPLAEALKATQAGERVALVGARVLPDGARMVVGSAVHQAQCWVEYQFRHLERYKGLRFEVDPEWKRLYESILANKPAGTGFELDVLKFAKHAKNTALMMPPPGKGLQGFIPDAVKGNPAEVVGPFSQAQRWGHQTYRTAQATPARSSIRRQSHYQIPPLTQP
jgi:outer membrane protein OmpA-like peptidoglycan-associated protein